MAEHALVDGVDGINARLVLCDIASGKISQAKTYSGLDYSSLEVVIRAYLEEYKVEMKDDCIAIAHPIVSDRVAMTSHIRTFSVAGMKKNFGFNHLETISNFTVVSTTISMLKKEHPIQFSSAEPVEGRPIVVHGAETGLGITHLVHVDEHWVSLSGEGGHVDSVPNSEEKGIILEILRVETGHVLAECMFPGPGPVNLYRTIVKADNRLPENLRPKNIAERALADSCIGYRRALSLLRVTMDRFGGNLALSLGTFSGVFTASGIVLCFLEPFEASGLRAAFEDKGRFKEYVHDIPVYLITHDNPGFLGSDAYLHQTLGHTF